MSDPEAEKGQHARSAIQRVVDVARQGQARLNAYRQEASAGLTPLRELGAWLRSQLLRQGSKGQQAQAGRSLRSRVTARRLRQRQETHRNGAKGSNAATYALQRVAQAVRRGKR